MYFKYNFEISEIDIAPRNFRNPTDADGRWGGKGKASIKASIEELKGFSISIILEDSTVPHQYYGDTWDAMSRANDKACEIIAAMSGLNYGGFNKDDNGDLRGQFVRCKLKSIEQIMENKVSE